MLGLHVGLGDLLVELLLLLVCEPFDGCAGNAAAVDEDAALSGIVRGLVGVEGGGDELGTLAAAAEEAAQAVGYEPEDRPYHPHLTLSRIRPA